MAVYTEPVWEEPEIRSKQGKYGNVLLALMENAGKWGRIGEYKSNDSAYQAALNLKNGRYKIPGSADHWEFVADGDKVFAKYSSNGDTKEDS